MSGAWVCRNFSWLCTVALRSFWLYQGGVFSFLFFSLRRSLELCPEIRTGIKEIVLEIKNELERKEAWILNPLIQFRQRQEAPEDINPQHRTLPEIP